jgi:hypothetical protein
MKEELKENKYEMKVYHQQVTVDKVWVEVYGTSKEDALKNFKAGEYEWLDSRQLDTIGGEFIDEEDWEFIEN